MESYRLSVFLSWIHSHKKKINFDIHSGASARVVMFCKAFLTVFSTDRWCSPIGKRNFHKKQNLMTERTPQSVDILIPGAVAPSGADDVPYGALVPLGVFGVLQEGVQWPLERAGKAAGHAKLLHRLDVRIIYEEEHLLGQFPIQEFTQWFKNELYYLEVDF